MRLVTFNCNFNKGGIGMLHEILRQGADVICVQRYDQRDVTALAASGYHTHFYTSFPGNPGMAEFGLLTLWRDRLGGRATAIDLTDMTPDDDRHQGNSMVRIDLDGYSVINCLVGYPESASQRTGLETWLRQVNQCMSEASRGRTMVVGDFHYPDGDGIWNGVNTGLLENKAAHLNTFRLGNGNLISLTKVFAPPDLLVHTARHAIEPLGHGSWLLRSMHWPVSVEYEA